jgi:transposase-like protein
LIFLAATSKFNGKVANMAQTKGKKRKFFEDEAVDLLVGGASVAETARKLGTARSTVHRWAQRPDFQELLEKARQCRRDATENIVAGFGDMFQETTPEALATWIHATYELNPDEVALVGMACEALRFSRDPELMPAVRLAAMNRFQSLLKDLNLPEGGQHGSTT